MKFTKDEHARVIGHALSCLLGATRMASGPTDTIEAVLEVVNAQARLTGLIRMVVMLGESKAPANHVQNGRVLHHASNATEREALEAEVKAWAEALDSLPQHIWRKEENWARFGQLVKTASEGIQNPLTRLRLPAITEQAAQKIGVLTASRWQERTRYYTARIMPLYRQLIRASCDDYEPPFSSFPRI